MAAGNEQISLNPRPEQFWRHPMAESFKLNSDAAIFGDSSGGLAMVIRDAAGRVILAASKFIPTAFLPAYMEAKALWFGLDLDQQVSFTSMEVESDNS